MERINTGQNVGLFTSPFTTAAQFGWALEYGRLPGWTFQLAFDGDRSYGVWTDGRRMLYRVAGEA